MHAANWVDDAEIELRLTRDPLPAGAAVVLLDLPETTPAQSALLQSLKDLGWDVEQRLLPQLVARCRRLTLKDADLELRAAMYWAALKLHGSRASRLAIVVSDIDRRQADLDRAIDQVSEDRDLGAALAGRVASAGNVRDNAFIGAGLNAIELLSPHGNFSHLSRWLRSPLVTGDDPKLGAMAAHLEMELRADLRSQLNFLDAYWHAGLRVQLEKSIPTLAARLESALQNIALDTPLKTPAAWARAWHGALAALGWSQAAQGANSEALHRWDNALDGFAELTPILGGLTCNTALGEFAALLKRRQQGRPLTLSGVHMFSHIDQVGPGYDGAWVTGLTDANWPEPARMNPLLPRTLQLEHNMPWASPGDALQRSTRSLERLRTRVAEVVFSWPTVQYDYRTEPSGLIETAELITPADLGLDGRLNLHCPNRAERRLQTVADPAPPLTGAQISGGARTLDLQALCPIRAFCQSRLHARTIEPLSRGVSARVQGIVIHRALELLLRDAAASGESFDIASARARIDEVVHSALSETFAAARRSLSTLYRLESQRLARLLAGFLDLEEQRSPFAVEQVEQRRDIEFGERRMRVRIDRVDRLSDGSLAVIDYKTGRFVKSPKWFADRLEETQLPLYALDRGPPATSVIVAALNAVRTRYFGIWPAADNFPGRSAGLPATLTWAAQLQVWRTQIETLVAEYAAGDVRLPLDSAAASNLAMGDYAPLTRAYELMRGRHDPALP
jgi:probable DNA repair protein